MSWKSAYQNVFWFFDNKIYPYCLKINPHMGGFSIEILNEHTGELEVSDRVKDKCTIEECQEKAIELLRDFLNDEIGELRDRADEIEQYLKQI